MATLRSFSAQNGLTRKEILNEREYLVVPVIAIFEGVLNALFVPAEEIARSAQGWNGRPIIVYHPKSEDGTYISANSPDLSTISPGQIYNAQWDDNKLKFEAWFDVEKTNQLGGYALEVMNRLEAGVLVEGSTGYFCDIQETKGFYHNKPYIGITHNILPDHYAFLPEMEGACSVEDGCGAPRVNQMAEMPNVMIGFFLSGSNARALSGQFTDWPEGSQVVSPQDMHLTLAYCGPVEEMGQGEDIVLRNLGQWASQMPIVRATVNGIARWITGPDQPHAVVATIDSTYLADWRNSLVYWMSDVMPMVRDHGFNPHITLGYVPADGPMNLIPPQTTDIIFDSVALAWGDRVTLFRLQGEDRVMEVSTNQKQFSVKSLIKNLAKKFEIELKNLFGPNVEVRQMDKKTLLVQSLVTCGKCGMTQEQFNALPEVALEAMAKGFQEQAAGAQPAPQANDQKPEDDRLSRLEQVVANVADSLKKITQTMQANEITAKENFIARIVAANSQIPKLELEKMSPEVLRVMADMISPVAADYSGQGLPMPYLGANVADKEWVMWPDYQNQVQN